MDEFQLSRRSLMITGAGIAGAALGAGVGNVPLDTFGKKRKRSKSWRPQMQFPVLNANGIAVSGDGKSAWVAVNDNWSTIQEWRRPSAQSNGWTFTTYIEQGPNPLTGPSGMALSKNSLSLYAADYGNSCVRCWTRASTAESFTAAPTTIGGIGTGSSEFQLPSDVFVTPDNLQIWVADTQNNRVCMWNRFSENDAWQAQVQITSYQGAGTALLTPCGVEFDQSSGQVFIANSGARKIAVWQVVVPRSSSSPRTGWQVTFLYEFDPGADCQFPRTLTLSSNKKTMWVVSQDGWKVKVFTRRSVNSSQWTEAAVLGTGTGNNDPENFWVPTGIAASNDGKVVYVSDMNNGRVSIWRLA